MTQSLGCVILNPGDHQDDRAKDPDLKKQKSVQNGYQITSNRTIWYPKFQFIHNPSYDIQLHLSIIRPQVGTKTDKKHILVPIRSHFAHILPFSAFLNNYFVLKNGYQNEQNNPIWYPFLKIIAKAQYRHGLRTILDIPMAHQPKFHLFFRKRQKST